jgi:hypothetical protein
MNETYLAEFLYGNLMIGANIIHLAHELGVEKLRSFESPTRSAPSTPATLGFGFHASLSGVTTTVPAGISWADAQWLAARTQAIACSRLAQLKDD